MANARKRISSPNGATTTPARSDRAKPMFVPVGGNGLTGSTGTARSRMETTIPVTKTIGSAQAAPPSPSATARRSGRLTPIAAQSSAPASTTRSRTRPM